MKLDGGHIEGGNREIPAKGLRLPKCGAFATEGLQVLKGMKSGR